MSNQALLMAGPPAEAPPTGPVGPVTFVGKVEHNYSGGASATFAMPGGLQEHDFALAVLAMDTNTTITVDSAGWGLHWDGIGNDDPCVRTYYKFMGATPDAEIDISSHFTVPLVVQVFRGVDLANPFDVAVAIATGNSSTPDPPARTSLTDGAMSVAIAALDDDNITSSTPPAGYTNQSWKASGGSSGSSASLAMASAQVPTAGAVDPAAFALSDSDQWRALHYLLRPAT